MLELILSTHKICEKENMRYFIVSFFMSLSAISLNAYSSERDAALAEFRAATVAQMTACSEKKILMDQRGETLLMKKQNLRILKNGRQDANQYTATIDALEVQKSINEEFKPDECVKSGRDAVKEKFPAAAKLVSKNKTASCMLQDFYAAWLPAFNGIFNSSEKATADAKKHAEESWNRFEIEYIH
jgi:hypothetical protein